MPRPASILLLALLVTACGRTSTNDAPDDVDSSPDAAPSSGTGSFTVSSDAPADGGTAAASYSFGASFGTGAAPCTSTTIGACTLNPCYQYAPQSSPSDPLPNAGPVTVSGSQLSSLSITPQADGTYTTAQVTGDIAWSGAGQTVTFGWSHLPADPNGPGDQIDISTPTYVSLPADSPLLQAPVTIARSQDLTVSWSADAQATDQVAVQIFSGSTQLDCIFGASAGMGVIPASALGALDAGAGTYEVHSKQFGEKSVTASEGTAWKLSFNVDARGRTPSGLATGAVTLQ